MNLETQHSFDVAIASKVGVQKAIILKEVLGWCEQNRRNRRNFHQGHYWTYNTAKAYALKFPYFKSRSIARWMDELVAGGWMYKGQFAKAGYDRTLSHRVDREKYSEVLKTFICQKLHIVSQNGQCISQNGQTITSSTTSLPTYLPSANESTVFLDEAELQDLDAQTAHSLEKEKSSGKKEKAVTLDDAMNQARARLRIMEKGQPAPRDFQPASIEDSHEARTGHRRRHMAFLETPEGKQEWAEILQEAGVGKELQPGTSIRYACQNLDIMVICGSTQKLLSKIHNVVKIEAKKAKEISGKIKNNESKVRNINSKTPAVTDEVALRAAAAVHHDYLHGNSLFGL